MSPNKTAKYLFEKPTNKKITSSFISDKLRNIKRCYLKENKITININPFTSTGLPKYAIIEMIEAGINQSYYGFYGAEAGYIY